MKWNSLVKWSSLALPALFIGALAVGCGDDEAPTGITIDDLAGTWIASPDNAGTDVVLAHPTVTLNLVTTLGGTVTLQVTTAERYTFTANVAALGITNLTITGDINITGNTTATITNDDDPGDVLNVTFNLSGDRLTLTVQDAELIDITQDGFVDADDAADLAATLDRSTS
jgi:hypothetical protein